MPRLKRSLQVTRKYHPRGETVGGFTVKKHPLYNTWVSLKQRCANPNNPAYKHYGARGISVCERWRSFAAFVADMGDKPSPQHSIERVDNDGNYCPENCVWATISEQRFNRRVFSNSVTGFAGVQPSTKGRFTSMVHVAGKRHYLGMFNSIEEAHDARQKFLEAKAGSVKA